MDIALIGGVERNESLYRSLAKDRSHTFKFHSGHMNGRGIPALESLLKTADLIVVVTDINSHCAVQYARRHARRLGIPLVLTRRCSPSRFTEILDDLKAVRATT